MPHKQHTGPLSSVPAPLPPPPCNSGMRSKNAPPLGTPACALSYLWGACPRGALGPPEANLRTTYVLGPVFFLGLHSALQKWHSWCTRVLACLERDASAGWLLCSAGRIPLPRHPPQACKYSQSYMGWRDLGNSYARHPPEAVCSVAAQPTRCSRES